MDRSCRNGARCECFESRTGAPGRSPLDPHYGVLFGVHPDTAPNEKPILTLGNNFEHVSQASVRYLASVQTEMVVGWYDAVSLASVLLAGRRLRFHQLSKDAGSYDAGAAFRYDGKTPFTCARAGDSHDNLSALVDPFVLERIPPCRRIPLEL